MDISKDELKKIIGNTLKKPERRKIFFKKLLLKKLVSAILY